MSDTVDADRIAALFQHASTSGRTPVEADAARPGRRPRWLRTVDFSRPTKFTTDQERRLTRAVEAFCRTGAARLSAERVPLELELLDCSQHTWTNANAQVPAASIVGVLTLEQLGTRIVLTVEHALLLAALETLLGGTPDRMAGERKLTDIDLVLVRRVFTALTDALSGVLDDHAGVTLGLASIDPSGEAAYVEQPSEPTLALTIEARLGRVASVMVLLLPYTAVEPILARLSGREDGGEAARDPFSADAVRQGVARVDVTVRAEVADRTMSIAEVLMLRAGDVVKLGAAAGSEVTLFAEDVPVHRARPGRSGAKRAVQVVTPIEAPR